MKKALLFFLVLHSACSTLSDIDTSTPEGAFEMASRYEKSERYQEAILRYSEVRTKYPYSKYALEAQLKIADIEYKREYFAEAASAYQIFREVNPKYPRLEYVIYKTAISFYNQVPSIVARDLSASKEALRYFSEYLGRYPKGTWAKEIQEKQKNVVQKLAQKEIYIGDFYYKEKKYFSALSRYDSVVQNYSFLDLSKEASIKALDAAIALDFIDSAKDYIIFLEKNYPKSKEYKNAVERGESHGIL